MDILHIVLFISLNVNSFLLIPNRHKIFETLNHKSIYDGNYISALKNFDQKNSGCCKQSVMDKKNTDRNNHEDGELIKITDTQKIKSKEENNKYTNNNSGKVKSTNLFNEDDNNSIDLFNEDNNTNLLNEEYKSKNDNFNDIKFDYEFNNEFVDTDYLNNTESTDSYLKEIKDMMEERNEQIENGTYYNVDISEYDTINN